MILRADARSLPIRDESVDAIVTDPPYGLEFMGREWDKLARPRPGNLGGFADGNKPSFERVRRHLPAMQDWHRSWAVEALRVAKPGAHLLAFGGTRTHHHLMCALEDAGWEIRDCLMWLYGSGFPKSLDVSKAIDKAAGAEREAVGFHMRLGDKRPYRKQGMNGGNYINNPNPAELKVVTAPATDAARQWAGWGTALKPAWEPIILARKPLDGTVAQNVQTWGTGALNVDGCRIGLGEDRTNGGKGSPSPLGLISDDGWSPTQLRERPNGGRWPANVILDEEAAAMLDAQAGPQKSGGTPFTGRHADKTRNTFGIFTGQENPNGIGGSAGAVSRFFYCAKASPTERGEGNDHPTVKPLALMRWLCRLVTPPGGVILDPFMGSGSTRIAACTEFFRFIGIELNERSCWISMERVAQESLPLTGQP